MKLNLEIAMDNSSFGETPQSRADELSNIFEELSERIGWKGLDVNTFNIRDSFGNTIGKAWITE